MRIRITEDQRRRLKGHLDEETSPRLSDKEILLIKRLQTLKDMDQSRPAEFLESLGFNISQIIRYLKLLITSYDVENLSDLPQDPVEVTPGPYGTIKDPLTYIAAHGDPANPVKIMAEIDRGDYSASLIENEALAMEVMIDYDKLSPKAFILKYNTAFEDLIEIMRIKGIYNKMLGPEGDIPNWQFIIEEIDDTFEFDVRPYCSVVFKDGSSCKMDMVGWEIEESLKGQAREFYFLTTNILMSRLYDFRFSEINGDKKRTIQNEGLSDRLNSTLNHIAAEFKTPLALYLYAGNTSVNIIRQEYFSEEELITLPFVEQEKKMTILHKAWEKQNKIHPHTKQIIPFPEEDYRIGFSVVFQGGDMGRIDMYFLAGSDGISIRVARIYSDILSNLVTLYGKKLLYQALIRKVYTDKDLIKEEAAGENISQPNRSSNKHEELIDHISSQINGYVGMKSILAGTKGISEIPEWRINMEERESLPYYTKDELMAVFKKAWQKEWGEDEYYFPEIDYRYKPISLMFDIGGGGFISFNLVPGKGLFPANSEHPHPLIELYGAENVYKALMKKIRQQWQQEQGED